MRYLFPCSARAARKILACKETIKKDNKRETAMAWDFETDPEYQKKLDWVEEFVENDVEPLTHLGIGMGGVKSKTYQKAVRPLQARVKVMGRWACHLTP